MTAPGAATRLAGAAGPVCRVRPAMFRILTTRRCCRAAFTRREPRRRMSRTCSVFGSFLLATLIAAPSAHAVCRSPKNICKHIDDCLQRTSDPNNKDAERIREGVRTRNGKMVWAGAEACASDLGRKRQWDNWVRECSDLEYVSIAKVEMEIGKVVCDRYSQ
jgi:hypothetical protein